VCKKEREREKEGAAVLEKAKGFQVISRREELKSK
jgi:hypothetical protein